MKYIYNSTLVIFLLFYTSALHAQVPEGFYISADGKSGAELKTALFNIIKNPKVIAYSKLWEAFANTDTGKNNKVWDMYSDNPYGAADYYYDFRNNRCGTFKKEGDCYNREHALPRSWFRGTKLLESDLFNLYPTDGYVNNRRSNLPFGEVGIASWESTNGSKIGQNTIGNYSKTVFEPIDEYKGDFARTYFYLVTAYEDELASWSSDQVGVDPYPGFSDWSLELLLKWHREDPVSIKEVRRNKEVYKIQGNRNPYIDYPDLTEYVWGVLFDEAFTINSFSDSFYLIEYSPFERWLYKQQWIDGLKEYLVK